MFGLSSQNPMGRRIPDEWAPELPLVEGMVRALAGAARATSVAAP